MTHVFTAAGIGTWGGTHLYNENHELLTLPYTNSEIFAKA